VILGRILELLTAGVQRPTLVADPASLCALHEVASRGLGVPQMFRCVYLCEQALAEVLVVVAPEARNLLHRASIDLLASYAEQLPPASPDGVVRDELTSLILRPVFDLALAQEVDRAHRHQQSLSLILFEVDNLTEITAAHGFSVGDRLIERLGIFIRRFFRHHDWVARHNGRSVAVLLPQTTLDDATDLAYHVRRMVEQRLVLVNHETGARMLVRLNAAAVGTELMEPPLQPAYVVAIAEDAIRRVRATGRSRVERVELPTPSVSLLGAATVLNCRPSVVRRLIRSGQLRAFRSGRHYHVERLSIERLRCAPRVALATSSSYLDA
jgi:diguanylate cyclase (GGDEF)-like protein/excisionase family DNA binding protein